MKNLLFFFLFLAQYHLISQTFPEINEDKLPYQENSAIFDSIGMHPNRYMGQIWVLDSSISYDMVQDEMVPGTKRTVINRNGLGELTSELWQYFDRYSQTWNNRFLREVKYYTPGQPEMKVTYPWMVPNSKWNEEPISLIRFDKSGNQIETFHRDVNFEGTYFNSGYRYLDVYDVNNNKTEMVSQYWYETEQDWENEFRIQNVYDQNNQLITIKMADWTGDHWQEYLLVEKTYNENGMLINSLEKEWDYMNDKWVKKYLYTYSYNNSGKITEELKQKWDNNNPLWVNNRLKKREYNANGLMIQEIGQYWNNDSLSWNNSVCQVYEYTNNNKILLDEFKKWKNNKWQIQYRYEYFYDQNNDLVKYLEKEYYVPEDSLLNSNQTIFIYDENDNRTEELYQFWNYETGLWMNVSRSENIYDDYNNLNQQLLQIWTNDNWNDYQRYD
ncbi:MAG: hypothetical protein GXO86_15495, partial [Chlorobi bacterium]|nr:hypothetical protein [Chlorobiota bacterium]